MSLDLCIHNVSTKFECSKCIAIITTSNSTVNKFRETVNAIDVEIRLKKLEQSRDAGSRTHKDIFERFEKLEKLFERIEHLEKWALTHETEGLEYGNEFEERDKKLTERLDRIDYKFCSSLNEHGKRIDELESHYYSDGDLSAIHGDIENIHKNMKHDEHILALLEEKFIKIENKLAFQMEVFKSNFAAIKSIQSKKPHQCPVCSGEGRKQVFTTIMEPFERREIDSLGRNFVTCFSCEGKGIIWG